MELPELSLAPSSCKLTLESNNSSSESSDTGSSRKRKTLYDGCFMENNKSLRAHRSIDLQQSNERLPLDWEQCLDLESGKMYFLNRKTMKKSWDRPTSKDHQHHHHQRQKLDLELNISSTTPTRSASGVNKCSSYMKTLELMGVAQAAIHNTRKDDHHHQSSSLTSYSNNKEIMNKNNSNNNNMVAMACMNCHLLVIVSKFNRTCPNCKYVHCIPPAQQISSAPRNPTFKPLDTLSLFS